MPAACSRENLRQVMDARLDAGLMPWAPSTLAIVLADPMPEEKQLALDALVAPGRVVGRHLHDERCQFVGDWGTAGPTVGIRPVPGDQATVPAKERLGPHTEGRPPLPRQQPAQRGEPRPIGQFEVGPRLVAAQDLELVAKHQDLDVFGPAGPEDQHHERERPPHDEVGERPQLGTDTVGQAHGEGTVVGSFETETPYSAPTIEFWDPTGASGVRTRPCDRLRPEPTFSSKETSSTS